MFWICSESVIVVFQSCDSCCVLFTRLKEFVEVFSVVFYVVCEVGSNMFVFCFPYVFGKSLLEGMESSPVVWRVVCLRASVESLFLAVLSA